jgi:hypothetical protein
MAKTYCASLGGHLMTNDEYMTIAYNVVNQGSNWSGGSVGSGAVYTGHNDGSPNNASQASNDDTQGYFGTDGPVSGGGTGTNATQKRTLSLSNGSVIWDFAGNINQEVQRSNMNIGDSTNTMAVPACSDGTAGWEYCQYSNLATPYVSSYSTNVTQLMVAPPNNSWYSQQNMGQLYTYGSGGTIAGANVFVRGGQWDIGATNGGLFELDVSWGAMGSHRAIGFRCVR